MKNEIKHTAHSSYRCEYHIVFAPKFRRKAIYGELKKDIGIILRKLCNEMKVEIIETEACPDHIHASQHTTIYECSTVCRDSQEQKCADDFRQACKSKVQIWKQAFWCRGYFVDTVGKNGKKIREYIQNQLEEDYVKDQISMKEYLDPYTGKKVKQKSHLKWLLEK